MEILSDGKLFQVRADGDKRVVKIRKVVYDGEGKVDETRTLNAEESIRHESRILKKIGQLASAENAHPHIVSMISCSPTTLVLERATCDAHTFLVEHLTYDVHKPKEPYRRYFKQEVPIHERTVVQCDLTSALLSALQYVHSHNLCHGDVKLENILVYHRHEWSYDFKLTDFDHCQASSKYIQAHSGTPMYKSPEALTVMNDDKSKSMVRGSGDKADMWAAGVVLYLLFNAGNIRWTPVQMQDGSWLFWNFGKKLTIMHASWIAEFAKNDVLYDGGAPLHVDDVRTLVVREDMVYMAPASVIFQLLNADYKARPSASMTLNYWESVKGGVRNAPEVTPLGATNDTSQQADAITKAMVTPAGNAMNEESTNTPVAMNARCESTRKRQRNNISVS